MGRQDLGGPLSRLRASASTLVSSAFGTACSHRREKGECARPWPQHTKSVEVSSFLASQAVATSTKDGYIREVVMFLCYASSLCLCLKGPVFIDAAFCRYFDELFEEGLGFTTGERLLSGWMDSFPEFRPGNFPFALRAVRGWRRLKPSSSRHPLPWLVAVLIACHMACGPLGAEGAIAVLVMFDAYLRPYELFSLRVCDVVFPAAQFTCVSLVICPFDKKKPTKTGVFDDSIPLNSVDRRYIAPLLAWWIATQKLKRDDFVFSVSHLELGKEFTRVCALLGLSRWGFVLYSCRHGGPSEDRANRMRSLLEIQKRGRWMSEKSVRRYEQEGRLHVVLSYLSSDFVSYGLECSKNLVACITLPSRVRVPSMSIVEVPKPLPFRVEE
jgi:hypothetical protein